MKDGHWRSIHRISVFALFIVLSGVYLSRSVVKNKPGAILPNELDFLDSIGYALVLTAVRYVFDELFREEVYHRVKLHDPINFETKKVKSLKEAFCTVWYAVMTIVGFCFFANTEYLPDSCFGSATCDSMPQKLLTSEVHWKVRMYFMIQFAYHSHTLVYYEVANREKKLAEYNEMMLHHILAVGLTICCYTSGYFNYGISFLLVSDLSDFWLNAGKANRDLFFNGPWLTDLFFVPVLASWGYFRGYFIPWCVLGSCYKALWNYSMKNVEVWEHAALRDNASIIVPFYTVKVILLSVLGLLNLYWVSIIIKMAFARIFLKRKSYANVTHGDKLQQGEKELPLKEK